MVFTPKLQLAEDLADSQGNGFEAGATNPAAVTRAQTLAAAGAYQLAEDIMKASTPTEEELEDERF